MHSNTSSDSIEISGPPVLRPDRVFVALQFRRVRKRTSQLVLFLGVPPLVACGCASLDAGSDLERSAEAVEQATGAAHRLLLVNAQAAKNKTNELLKNGLTADEVVQIALLNNPRVRAAMLSIGVSRADFVQSTLFTNPTLTLSLRLPDGGGLANFGAELTQNIAELWLIPSRKLAAQRDLDRTVLEAARTAASVALAARKAYVRAARTLQQSTIAQDNLTIADRLVEIALLRQKAGSGSEIDVNLARTQKLEAETIFRNAQLATIEGRSNLARTLGLSDSPETFSLTDGLPDPGTWSVSAGALQETAGKYRLDLRIADQSVAAAEARCREERLRFLKSLEVGFAMERGERRSRGPRKWASEIFYNSLQGVQLSPPNLMPREDVGIDVILGPTLGIELPIWDQNQAQITKADHLLEQAVQWRDALFVDASQDIHSRLARARTAAENARFYRDEQLPAAERSVKLSHDAYRAGRVSFLSVLEAERSYLAARSGHLAALESAALSAVELERVTGRPAAVLLSDSDSQAPASTQPATAPASVEVSP